MDEEITLLNFMQKEYEKRSLCVLFQVSASERLFARIFQKRAGVAFKASELGALDGAAAETLYVSFRRQFDNLRKLCVRVALARLEAWLAGRLLKTIPGANVLANVAAVEPALSIFCNFTWNRRSAQLNRRVRDATVRVNDVRLDDCIGRAGFDAERASSAMVLHLLRVAIRLKAQEQFPEEDPGAVGARDEVRVLAYPAKPCARGPGFVHQGLNVHANFSFRFRPSLLNPREQGFQLVAHHVVIIITPGVTRNFSGRALAHVLVRRVIVERDRDD